MNLGEITSMFWFFPQILLILLFVVFIIVYCVIKKSEISVKQYYTNYIGKSYKTSQLFNHFFLHNYVIEYETD